MVQDLTYIDTTAEDSVEWLPSGTKQFTVRSAKEFIRRHGERVMWWNVVWFKGHVPRFAFILWMAFKKKLLSRLKEWGCVNDDSCVLCNGSLENIEHLFFDCGYTKIIWEEILRRNGIQRCATNWSGECNLALMEGKGRGFEAHIRLLTLSAAVYYIWWERNSRIFKQEGHYCSFVMKQVEENITTWHWQGKRTCQNWMLCREWGLYDCIELLVV